jgi:5'(3')-deoxyribonucleotidase
MKRKTIALDIDDVIADATEAMRISVNKKVGVDLKKEHYLVEGDYWGYYERVWGIHGIEDKITYADHAREMELDQSHVPLLPGASFAIGELSKQYDIVLITARDLEWEKATLKWIKHHFGDAFRSIHFAGNKHLSESKTKGRQAKELGASLLIDDNPGHCQTALDEGLEAILFGEYGWHYDIPDGLIRCKDWPAVLEYLNAKS